MAIAAGMDDRLDCLGAHTLERGKCVTDGARIDRENRPRAIDRWRQHSDSEPVGLGAEFCELVGIAQVESHGGGQEFDWIVRLHVGGLVGQQRIGCRM